MQGIETYLSQAFHDFCKAARSHHSLSTLGVLVMSISLKTKRNVCAAASSSTALLVWHLRMVSLTPSRGGIARERSVIQNYLLTYARRRTEA